MPLTVKIAGRLKRNLDRAITRLASKCEVGLEAVGEVLLNEAVPLVPRDLNALADSGRVSKIGSLFRTVVVVGFGGKDFPARTEYSEKEGKIVTRKPSEYAIPVHERVDVEHATGQANFLGEPLMTKQDEMRAAFKAEVKR